MQCTTLQVAAKAPSETPQPISAGDATGSNTRYAIPATDVYSAPEGWILSIDLPGVTKDRVALSVDDGVLDVRATRDDTSGFARRFRLPRGVDSAGISARHDDGVLSVSVPREPDAAPVHITVT